MKVRVYKEDELKSKYKKDFKPMTDKDIEYCSWLCSWNFVKHSSGQIVKCEGTPENKWRILGANGLFPMEIGQLVLGIKKQQRKNNGKNRKSFDRRRSCNYRADCKRRRS